MDDTVPVPRELVERIVARLDWYGSKSEIAAAELRACIPPPPYGPSDRDITDYCEAMGWAVDRTVAATHLRNAHKRGWNLVPTRIEDSNG